MTTAVQTFPEDGAVAEPADDEVLLIRSTIISSYAQIAASVNLDPLRMLRRVGLDPAVLANSETLIPAAKVTRLIELSAVEAKARDFGLRLALARGTPDIGPLNLLLREEPDLRSALRSLQNYLHVHSRSLRVALEEQGPYVLVKGGLAPVAAPCPAPQSTEMIILGVLLSLRWLVGSDWRPVMACFSHAAFGDSHLVESAFRCPVEFGHAFDGLVLTREDLQRPVQSSNPLLRRHAEEYVRMLATLSAGGLEDAVAGLIAALLPSGSCSSAKIARRLGMDRSTLNRRLTRAGLSYSAMLQSTRVNLATRLCFSGAPLVQVADQLGFSSPSVCSRWFSQSFGCSPRMWRKRQAFPGDASAADN